MSDSESPSPGHGDGGHPDGAIRDGAPQPSPEDFEVEPDETGTAFIAWLLARLDMPGFARDKWSRNHDLAIIDFLGGGVGRVLVAFMDQAGSFRLVLGDSSNRAVSPPAGPVTLIMRTSVEGGDDFDGQFQLSSMSRHQLSALLRTMDGVFLHFADDRSAWPESLRLDFKAHAHKFMAALTEVAQQETGATRLYTPKESLPPPREAAADQHLVQRLESMLIHWTRQIKELVGQHGDGGGGGGGGADEPGGGGGDNAAGPLEEIAFWQRRADDLSGLRAQLDGESVSHIVRVLEEAGSSYLDAFQGLAAAIRHGQAEAQDNLRFLAILRPHCEKLAEAAPSDIPTHLPSLLHRLRAVHNLSPYYADKETMTGLCCRVSNLIISRCRHRISVRNVFHGPIGPSSRALRECVACGAAWKRDFSAMVAHIRRNEPDAAKHWTLDVNAIFAQVDAFIQRCRDLLEICEGRMQFMGEAGRARAMSVAAADIRAATAATKGRLDGGDGEGGAARSAPANATSPFPVFGGVRGPMVVGKLHGMKRDFQALLRRLERVDYDVLDVKGTRWHDDYNTFKTGIKELNRKMQALITFAFEAVSTVDHGVQLLLAFSSFVKAPSLRQWVEKKTSEVWQLFLTNLRSARASFESLAADPPLAPTDPSFAGPARTARSLSKRIAADYALLEGATELPRVADAALAKDEFIAFDDQVRAFVSSQYRRWLRGLNEVGDSGVEEKLEMPLLKRLLASSDGSKLETNFDSLLNSTCNEVHSWRLMDSEVTVPSLATSVSDRGDTMRVSQNTVKEVVRLYNDTLDMLEPDERKLFSDHIRKLDRKVGPGLRKISWAKQATVERFVNDATGVCKSARATFAAFQAKRAAIAEAMDVIASHPLLAFERNRVYTVHEFEDLQAAHRQRSVESLQSHERMIVKLLVECQAFFHDAAPPVRKQWRRFLRTMDEQMGEALALGVRRSLQAMVKATNVDSRHATQPLFSLNVVLHDEGRVALSPSLEDLSIMITDVTKGMIATTSTMQRLPGLIEGHARQPVEGAAIAAGDAADGGDAQQRSAPAEDRSPDSFFANIMHMPAVLKLLRAIASGVTATSKRVEAFTQYWLKYSFLWDRPKDVFMQRFEKVVREAKPQSMVSTIEAEMARCKVHQASIEAEDQVSKNIDFIQADGSKLKSALVQHCLAWQTQYSNLLARIARDYLDGTVGDMEQRRSNLSQEPATLAELDEKMQLLNRTRSERNETEAFFGDLDLMYEVLRKYEVPVTEEETATLEGLRGRFSEFHTEVARADDMLQTCKKAMRLGCEESLIDFVNAVDAMYEESRGAAGLPANRGVAPADAASRLQRFTKRCTELRQEEKEISAGLRVFEIDQPDLSKVDKVEGQLSQLEEIWALRQEWEEAWETLKQRKFKGLDTDELKQVAAQFGKRITKLGRTSKSIGAWADLRAEVDRFRDTLPLVEALASDAMRERHWDKLMKELGERFDPQGDDFTLARMASMGLVDLAEFVMELSGVANKELSIEQALVGIAERWSSVEVDMGSYKTYTKIRSTEDLFQALEDDQVAVSTMKASQFYLAFKAQLDEWDGKLSRVSEVMELMLQVQRAWMYLESIFIGSEDIRRQLPTETKLFDGVNSEWMDISSTMAEDKVALGACSRPRVLERLTEMDEGLERIQKSLDQYLETKRQLFPRFYFLSNDDLLEILGQQRDPEQVQVHIKKCFEGIARLDLEKNAAGKFEARGMQSSDGERVALEAPVLAAGAVELWLIEVEREMRNSLRVVLARSMKAYRGTKADKRGPWINEFPGQLLITTGKIGWTADCTRVLSEAEESADSDAKAAVKKLRKKQVKYLNKLADMVRSPDMGRVNRMKVVALITMEIHSRDVMERMIKARCASVNDFVWLSQLRYYFEEDAEHDMRVCKTRQTNTNLYFGYEYQGNNGRLVVTPLTDRCILTLTTALHLQRGGNPLGPAGTGKTETVKDLGKNLAKYVVVFNCSDGLDYKSVGRMFSGLVQSGGWGCFDEFNRIEVEVLSVVAQQIMTIMAGIAARQQTIFFEGEEITCNANCGIFVTMNPGYAGRSELPDNLKALMRPVAMMVPDLAQIAEVMLMAEGFREAKELAKKTVSLYSLMVQQLSKQDHYDYGLRSLKAVLNRAGALKRDEPGEAEDRIVLRALRDMNVPKFIKEDYRLFILLLGDLFPGLDLPASESGSLGEAMRQQLTEHGLQQHEALFGKMVQLHESKLTRHCNMLVGHTMGGKSTLCRTLAGAKSALAKAGEKGYRPVRTTVLNPKSVTLAELYGAYDLSTMEWADGVLSTLFRTCAQDTRGDEQWILLDGPVDTLWIESMNTVMDDNKTLTLINGDRIAMSTQMSLLFEVQDLAVASPATVSRAGMVYVDAEDLGWRPLVHSWLEAKFPDRGDPEAGAATRDLHLALFDKYVAPLLEKMRVGAIRELVPSSPFAAVVALCRMLDSLLVEENHMAASADVGEEYQAAIERWFVFAVVWSVGATVDAAGRKGVDALLRELGAPLPTTHLVYDFFIDPASGDAKPWEEQLSSTWAAPPGTPFFRITVPTVDTQRHRFMVERLMSQKHHVLLVGNTGTGKSVLASATLQGLPSSHTSLVINFSAATTAGSVQDAVEGVLEKRSKNKFGPPGGRRLVTFVDDLNMPKRDTFGSQPPLELLKQWIDYGGWYDRQKQAWRFIVDMQLVGAMAPPGGGRSKTSGRIQSRFALLNLPFPDEKQVRRIFDAILQPHLAQPGFAADVRSMAPKVVLATVQVYHDVVDQFLPTPSRSHYLFNLRDIAKVVQGMLTVGPAAAADQEGLLRAWVHESMRIFSDRFVSMGDQERFQKVLAARLEEEFELELAVLLEDCPDPTQGPLFTSLTAPAPEPGDAGNAVVPSVAEVTEMAGLKAMMEEKLEEYNSEPGLVPMDLVLFGDALLHVCRVVRVLGFPRGNAMLVGVGGSGRQSLTRLAAFIKEMRVFQVEIKKNYRSLEFREDLKALYTLAGVDNKQTVFLFNDTQIKEESFLEDINNILSSGIVPNLFEKDELTPLLDGVRVDAKKEGLETAEELWSFFVGRVRDNLHIVLAMSPVGEGFRNRTRMYPSLVNCTTIDWFHPWPADALQEVAARFLSDVKGADDELKVELAKSFAFVHESVATASARMVEELSRHNYVTPTNYLELVKGYIEVLAEKQSEISDASGKLKNGLAKLEESREQVEEMSKELAKKKVVVAQKQKDCEELLVVIVAERREAEAKKAQVESERERIAKEEADCKRIADDAQADLNIALPALEKAMAEVDKLDKSAISEVKAYSSPPPAVEMVLSAVMVLFGLKTDWATAKKKIGEPNFLAQVKGYNKDAVSNKSMAKIKAYVKKPGFTPEEVGNVSKAAGALCVWVCAIHVYGTVFREVAPKREALQSATKSLQAKQKMLAKAEAELEEVAAKVAKLQEQYDTSVGEKNSYKAEAEMLEEKLSRAEQLITGLGGERERWEASIAGYEVSFTNAVGDALLSAGYLSYAGPFDTVYRDRLVKGWLEAVHGHGIPVSPDFHFASYMSKPTDVRDWNIQGLPRDGFSTENGVIATRGRRWPLMVDPQGQANKWIKNLEGAELNVCDLKMRDFLRKLENAIQFGMPYLLQDVTEELDPSLEPVLTKAIVKVGTREVIRLGDKDVDYSRDFRLYITTKLPNPHYTPEVSTKVTLTNFAVKEQGLEAQLLGIVVREEKPSLEQQKSELVVRVAAGKRKLVDLENDILRLLSAAQGSLLDDDELVKTLQASKVTSEEVTAQLQESEETEGKIDAARMGYKPVSSRASILFFVLNDMGRVDPMYQFSLDAYISLFVDSIVSSRDAPGKEAGSKGAKGSGGGGKGSLAARIQAIIGHHTYAVYKYACRGLFERHKILLSLQMCAKKMAQDNALDRDEYDFFLRGGLVMDRSDQAPNPCAEWLDAAAWDNVTVLDSVASMKGIAGSFEQSGEDWRQWYLGEAPESADLPGEWGEQCSELQRMCIVRSLRQDRVLFAASRFIGKNLGARYVEPPPFDLEEVHESSTSKVPLIFVLSPGVDPIKQVQALAERKGTELHSVALGQGQSPIATRLIEEGLKRGHWVFLANCHLMVSWMPALEKIIETFVTQEEPHPDFRLWLSSSPTEQFPITILQRGIKMTTEPPQGLRANMTRLFNLMTEDQLERCQQKSKYKKLLFSLCWFHSVLLERRKFKSLGFNIPYEFNDSDFAICEDILRLYLDEYPDGVPWDALRYLVAEANYGGRVTDDWDRRLVNVYIEQFFCNGAVTQPRFRLSELDTYYIPDDGKLAHYKDVIRAYPQRDRPEAFGQHPNADIASMIENARDLLNTVIELQPRSVAAEGESDESKVLSMATELEAKVPPPFDLEDVKANLATRDDPDPLKTVLLQELERYNALLVVMAQSLAQLQQGIRGLVVITSELEELFDAILLGRIPPSWGFCYPSLKTLGAWITDLEARVQQMREWADLGVPAAVWLSGFTYPTGFLTALMQTSARKNGLAIDSLSWEFPVLQEEPSALTKGPDEGAYVYGMFLEGARWNAEKVCLTSAAAMELFAPMPVIHFKPTEGKRKTSSSHYYTCPLYLYPLRTGTRERPSFMTTVQLRAGDVSPTFWTKRGTALLLSLTT